MLCRVPVVHRDNQLLSAFEVECEVAEALHSRSFTQEQTAAGWRALR